MTTAKLSPSSSSRDDFDMDDDADDLAYWSALRGILGTLQAELFPIYKVADSAAVQQQKQHDRLVRWTAIFGTVAVLCAVLELAVENETLKHVLSLVELLSAIPAVVLVFLGLRSAFHPGWLLNRFVAEQCRFIKFHFLLNPALWQGKPEAEIRSQLQRRLKPIRENQPHGKHFIEKWVMWKISILEKYQPAPVNLPSDVAGQLTDYCTQKRLMYQQSYFEGQVRRRQKFDQGTRWIPPACFFLSIIAAFLHFLFEKLAGKNAEGTAAHLAHFCTILAAAFPVAGAGMRTYRSAFEFGRNQLRFAALAQFLGSVQRDAADQPFEIQLAQLREAENSLDAELRAWLRLMLDAEWFG